jgi:hypothetical protein
MVLQSLKERLVGWTGGLSGTLSLLGGYNICHSACLALIAGLSFIGIGVQGMPLLFLQDWAPTFWSAAIILLAVSFYMYRTRKCISKNLLVLNTGLLIAAFPFPGFEAFQTLFWAVGFGLVGVAVFSWLYKKFKRKKELKACCQEKK